MNMFFDAWITLSRGVGLADYQVTDVRSLGRMLDKYGITKALVTSFAARELDVEYGNELVFQAAARVLFGSDAPWMSYSHQIGRVLFADIIEQQKKTILIDNPKRILNGAV